METETLALAVVLRISSSPLRLRLNAAVTLLRSVRCSRSSRVACRFAGWRDRRVRLLVRARPPLLNMIGSPVTRCAVKNDQPSANLTGEMTILGEVVKPGCSRNERSRLTEADVFLHRTSLTNRPTMFDLARPNLTARNGNPSSTVGRASGCHWGVRTEESSHPSREKAAYAKT